MSLQHREAGDSVRHISESAALHRIAPPSHQLPGRRPSWLTTIDVPSRQNEQDRLVQPASLQSHHLRGGLASIINNHTSHVSLNNASNSPSGLRLPSHQGRTRAVSGAVVWPLVPIMEPRSPASCAAMASGHESTNALMASQPFTPASSDESIEELFRQLQLQKVSMPPMGCHNLLSKLLQQSTTIGRDADNVLSAVCIGAARVAAKENENAVPSGGRGHDGANGSILGGVAELSSRSRPAHAYAHAGFPGRAGLAGRTSGIAIGSGDVAGRIGLTAPPYFANAHGCRASYSSNDAAMSSGFAGYANPTQLDPRGLGAAASPAGHPSPNDLTRSKNTNVVGDRCLAPGLGGLLAPAGPPAVSSSPGITRSADARGLFGRIQSPKVYSTPDALQDADNQGKCTPMNTGGTLITRPSSSQPSLATKSAVTMAIQTTGFVPMLAVTRPGMTGRDVTPTPLGSQAIIDLKFSPHYRGMHTETNASADHLRSDQNCSLWITQLPPDIKVPELLGRIRNIGRVYATVLSPPDGIKHAKSAAKLVFFTPAGAQKLLAHGENHPLVIRGHRAQIMHNRTKCDSQSTERGESRVLIITGHKQFVNESSLTAYFEGRFTFQIDKVQTLVEFQDRAVVEYQFGSYRCQSQMGLKALLLDRPRGLEMVEFGADPCEVGSDTTSFTVAGERIQGRGLFPDLEREDVVAGA